MIGFLLFAALQQPVSPDIELQIALRLYQGERVSSSVTTGKNDTLSGSIWADASMCGVGSSETASSGPDRIRWQYTARILQRNGSSYTVEIEWQRDGGPFGSAARTTQQVVLQLGQPQVLDTLTPSTSNACGVTTLRVDASIVPASPRGFTRSFGGGGGRGVGAGAAAGGFGGAAAASGGFRGRGTFGTGVNGAGASANAGGGTGQNSFSLRGLNPNMTSLEFARMLASGTYTWDYRVAPATVGASGGGARGAGAAGSGAGGSGAARGGAGDLNLTVGGGRGMLVVPPRMFNPPLTPISTGSYDAELWLVHTPPGGKEETEHATVHFGADGDAVAFPLVTVPTANGSTTVDVAVSLRVMADDKGANVLRVIIVRRLDGGSSVSSAGSSTSAAGSSTSASTGATTKVIPLPASSDTVSFELPPARGFSANALADHPFSVRLKLTSGKDDEVR